MPSAHPSNPEEYFAFQRGVQESNAMQAKIVQMSKTVEQMQGVIVEMILKGLTHEEIAEMLQVEVKYVQQFASTEKFIKDITARALHSKASSADSARTLLNVAAFSAAGRLLQLVLHTDPRVALKACELTLNHALMPARLADLRPKSSVGSPEEARKEIDDLERRKAVLLQKHSA